MGFVAGKGTAIYWGTIAQDAKYKIFESGRKVANFSIRYDSESTDGKPVSKYMDCSAWGDKADFASGLERGDVVLAAGRLQKDEYNTKRRGVDTYLLNVDFLTVEDSGGSSGSTPTIAQQNATAFKEYDDDGTELPF